jgi:membrane-associated protease RseP (regulator of RpoE activity)
LLPAGLLLLLTLLTAAASGARFHANFAAGKPAFDLTRDWDAFLVPLQEPEVLQDGIPFALALVGILLAHELGHYLACRHYGVASSLPLLIPFPSFVGTLGGFVRIRSVLYSRRILFDVAIAGPLTGFLVATPILFWGLAMSRPDNGAAGGLSFGEPLLQSWARELYFPGAVSSSILLHPLVRAAWVGLFATALNLLPIGQLDGGHILFAVAPRWHQRLSQAALILLLPLGFFYWPWFLWAVVLFWWGQRHPWIQDDTPLDGRRLLLATLALGVFLITFIVQPLT